jgi:hypothetical protein
LTPDERRDLDQGMQALLQRQRAKFARAPAQEADWRPLQARRYNSASRPRATHLRLAEIEHRASGRRRSHWYSRSSRAMLSTAQALIARNLGRADVHMTRNGTAHAATVVAKTIA